MRKFSLFFFLIILSFQCTEPTKQEKLDRKVFEAYPSGTIHPNGSLDIVFKEKRENFGLPLASEIFSIEPKVDGIVTWKDEYTISFSPEKSFRPNQSYKVKCSFPSSFNLPNDQKSIEFNFTTEYLHFSLQSRGFTYPDITTLNKLVYRFDLTASAHPDPEELKSSIQILLNGKELDGSSWSLGPGTWTNYNYTIIIPDIPRTEEQQLIELNYDGKIMGSESKGSIIDSIPAIDDFTLVKVFKPNNKDRIFHLVFSDPLDQGQSIEGLVDCPDLNERLTLDKNRIIVEITDKASGKKELVISPEIRNAAGYRLDKAYRRDIQLQAMKPKLAWTDDGHIVPASKSSNLRFKSVNLKAVNIRIVEIFQNNAVHFFQENYLGDQSQVKRYGRMVKMAEMDLESKAVIIEDEWMEFAIDLSKLTEIHPGSIYRIYLHFDPDQVIYEGIPEKLLNRKPGLSHELREKWYDEAENLYGYYWDRDYRWDRKNDPTHISYYLNENNQLSKNVLVSNLGLMVKSAASGIYKVFVNDITSNAAEPGVKIDLYNFQNQLLHSSTTDQSGKSEVRIDEVPFLLVADKNGERAYQRLDNGSALSLSSFAADGIKTREGLKGYLYAERGVWRPGDSVFFNLALEQSEENRLPSDHPIHFEVRSASGISIHSWNDKIANRRIIPAHFATDVGSVTGRWQIIATVGNQSFRKNFAVETIKPNRLDILFANKEPLTGLKSHSIPLRCEYLTGIPASDLAFKVERKIRAVRKPFEKFPEYIFNANRKKHVSDFRQIHSGNFDAKGESAFQLDLSSANRGVMDIELIVRTTETGGNINTNFLNKRFYPFDRYVGIHIPNGSGWRGSMRKDDDKTVKLVISLIKRVKN